jgi:hypothetical protein
MSAPAPLRSFHLMWFVEESSNRAIKDTKVGFRSVSFFTWVMLAQSSALIQAAMKQTVEDLLNQQTRYSSGELVPDERLIREDGHWWKCCQLQASRLRSSPDSNSSLIVRLAC